MVYWRLVKELLSFLVETTAHMNLLPPDKMAAIYYTISVCIFVNEKFCILIPNSLMFVPNDPTDTNPALV